MNISSPHSPSRRVSSSRLYSSIPSGAVPRRATAALLLAALAGAAAAQTTLPQMPKLAVNEARVLNSQGVTRAWTPLTSDTAGLLPAPVFPRAGLERTIHVPLPVRAKGVVKREKRAGRRDVAIEYDPAEVRNLFAAGDRDADGYLTLREAHLKFQLAPETFDRADKNGDRLLSFVEFDERLRGSATWGGFFIDTKAVKTEAPKPEELSFESVARERVRARLAMADLDADARLRERELEELLASVAPRWKAPAFLNRYDVDGDGGVDEEELYQAILDLRASGDPEIGLKAEQLSRELAELRDDADARAGALLRAFDRDGDSSVDAVEMEAALASLDTPLGSGQLLSLDKNQDLELDRLELEAALSSPEPSRILAPLADFLAERFPLGLVPTPLSKLDRDDDERVAESELAFWLSRHPNAAPAPSLMAKFDRDKSGYLDLLEVLHLVGRVPATGPAGAGAAPAKAALPESFRLLDQDENGALSYREISGVFERELRVPGQGEKVFAQCDRDSDGELDPEEIVSVFGSEKPLATSGEASDEAPPTAPTTRALALQHHDTDRDGGLGEDELEHWAAGKRALLSPRAFWKAADRDRDGRITATELDATLAAQSADTAPSTDAGDLQLEIQSRLPLPLGLAPIDASSDRRISPQELGAALDAGEHSRVRALFRAYDADASGHLEAAELRWLGLR